MSAPRPAIVTGATRGIGLALTEGLLERGWAVLGVGRGPEPGALAGRAGYTHRRLDLGDADAVRAFATSDLPAHLGGAADELLLVHNAGMVTPVGPADRLGLEPLEHALRVNLTAPMELNRAALALDGAAPLRVVCVSSGAAERPIPGWSAYCTAKAGLAMAARCLAEDAATYPHLAGRTVRVLSWAPGVVDTEMQGVIRGTRPEDFPPHARFVELHEGGSLATPEAAAADLLARLGAPQAEPFESARYSG